MTLKPSNPSHGPVKTQNTDEITARVDKAGEELGFSARNQTVERRKKKSVTKPTDQFNLRAHIEDINRFVTYAEDNRKSYREVFEELVKKLPKK